MFFQQVYDESLAQASYIIGCQVAGEALVIDPKRDVDTYIQLAKKHNLTITKIVETHIHADFLSGSRELSALTGAGLYLSDEGGADWQYEFPHEGLHDGDSISLGNLTFEVLHTPGHTPESISFLLTDKPASEFPVMLFTGDFVFVGDIGRPDLLEKAAGIKGSQDLGAAQMYSSIDRFRALPDYIQLWPGHGAGSACGKALGAVPSSTIGYEKIRNWALKAWTQELFAATLLAGQPEPPTYFATMKKRNKVDRPLLLEVPKLPELSQQEFEKAYAQDVLIIDTRLKGDFAEGHIPNSLNIQGTKTFATWCGWMLSYAQPFILIAEEPEREELTRKLMRIGMDQALGFIPAIKGLEMELEKTSSIAAQQLQASLGDDAIQLVDVRNAAEFQAGHIPGAINLFVGTLAKNLSALSRHKKIVIYCQSGDRAAIASSLLLREGFKNLSVYFPGMQGWRSLGFEEVSA